MSIESTRKILSDCDGDPLLYKGTKSVSCLAYNNFLSKGLMLEKLYTFAGKVPTIFPWDVEYGDSRFNVNHRFNIFPLMIVLPITDKQISKALKFSRKYNIQISLRGGRHCAEWFSLTSGMVIDQGQRKLVIVDEKRKTMIVQPGVLIGPTIEELWNKYRLFVPSGLCSSVALNGLVLGGGVGFSQRKYGLTCDSLLEANIILADGKQVVANNYKNKDLFWALRGAGNGNFGIVTSLKFQLYPVDNVTAIELVFPFSSLKKVWRVFQKFACNAPRELTLELNLATSSTTEKREPKLSIIGQSYSSVKTTKKILSPLLALCPTEQKIESMTYPDAARFFGAQLSRLPFYKNKNAFINTLRWPSKAIEMVGKFFSSPDTPPNSVLEFDAMGGAIEDVSPTDTAFVARKQKYWMLLQTNWSEEKFAEKQITWITELYNLLSPYFSDLAYVNQPDSTIKNYLTTYYGENLPRLMDIKTVVDPNNVFNFEQSIPPNIIRVSNF